ncbi:MAG: hypothetical protein QXT64_01550 [Desulfurococcaceae archaeon]
MSKKSIRDYLRRASRFLTADDVKNGDELTIVGGFEEVPPEKSRFGRAQFRAVVRLPDGTEKTWSMNKTTLLNLAEVYGDDYESWVGKKVRVEIRKMMIRGDTANVIVGFPVISEEDARVAEARRIRDQFLSSGLREVSVDDLSKLLRLTGSKLTVEDFLKLLKLEARQGRVRFA